ncbi:MAG: zinc metalloprotease HtpX [bacterium]|nr:zinc metalloprotease HtpX [bacterium]
MLSSFFEIEKRKNRSISGLFFFLILYYFLSSLLLWTLIKIAWNYFMEPDFSLVRSFSPDTRGVLVILLLSSLAAFIHWQTGASGAVNGILNVLRAEPLRLQDRYHQMLYDVIEETSAACGGIKFECALLSTSGLNAFSLADQNGRLVIGFTEGLLAKLNRNQLRAVVSHEAAHLLNGDSAASTLICSLFSLRSTIVKNWLDRLNRESRFIASLFRPVSLLLALVDGAGKIFHIFLSREREYRADILGSRLTRDPLSLAEALYIISRSWRGETLTGQDLSAVFIVDPCSGSLDEEEGLFSDLFSVHPPIGKRIDVLLKLADAGPQSLDGKEKESVTGTTGESPLPDGQERKWYVADRENKWKGPFSLSEIAGLGWFSPSSWVRRSDAGKAVLAREAREFHDIPGTGEPAKASSGACPDCSAGLKTVEYEANSLEQCSGCGRMLIRRKDLLRILMRKEKDFSPETVKMAELLLKDAREELKDIPIRTQNLLACPKCRGKMNRVFFNWNMEVDSSAESRISKTGFLPLVMDKCVWCDLLWLEPVKLEVLQYIYEKYGRIVK